LTQTLISIFPNPNDLLALEPEELGGVILEIAPGVIQNGMFNLHSLTAPLFSPVGNSYPLGTHRPVVLALAEALSWLVSEGLLVLDPDQPAQWYRLTRRAMALRTRTDVEAYRKGRILPTDLLQPALPEKVRPQFLRADHDVAVFQAFKEVEVAVRNAANQKGAGYPDDLVGIALMRKAFHPDNGPLTDTSLVVAEREADMHLFSGAIGHAKNPTTGRAVRASGGRKAYRFCKSFAVHCGRALLSCSASCHCYNLRHHGKSI
jgi:Protein of unknown function (Hypoth_ymh)